MGAAVRVAEIQRHAELVVIQVKMKTVGFRVALLAAKWAPAAFGSTNPGWLDLDYFRSEIGEQFRRHRRGEKWHGVKARQLHHLDTVERERGVHNHFSSWPYFSRSSKSTNSAIERIRKSGR